MKRFPFLYSVILMAVPLLCSAAVSTASDTEEHKSSTRIPVYFEPNQGQATENVKYMARVQEGVRLFLTSNGAVLSINTPGGENQLTKSLSHPLKSSEVSIVLRMTFIGANPNPEMTGVDKLSGKVNYLIGNDRSRWRTKIPTYRKVRYAEIYPNIDLLFYTNNGHPEYDFELDAGIDPAVIQIGFQGQQKLQLDSNGNLVITTASGEVVQPKPVAYQMIASRPKLFTANYRLINETTVALAVKDYDKNLPLRIDPEIIYSTYLGGTYGHDIGAAIAVGSTGSAYVAGFTSSSDFPVTTSTPFNNGYDGFVAKLTPDGDDLEYATYIGGSADDVFEDVTVDATGNAYVAGRSVSVDFPTTFAFQTNNKGGQDGVVLKLSSDGSELVYSSYIGSETIDYAFGIAVDHDENAYITGTGASPSTSFPITADAFIFDKPGGWDGFFAKIGPSGSLLYCSYLGGSGEDAVRGIVSDDEGNVYITGRTCSNDFPFTPGAYKTTNTTSCDAFVSKFSMAANDLVYSTYLGGDSSYEDAPDIAIDEENNVYIVGMVNGTDFPTTTDAWIESAPANYNGFIAKLNAGGSDLVYGSYIGGSAHDGANGVFVDQMGHAIITGVTASSDFPLVDPVDDVQSGWEAYIVRLNPDGTDALFSSYLGGSSDEAENITDAWYRLKRPDVALDASGVAYITGGTFSLDFPTTFGAFQETSSVYWDGYVSKIKLSDEDFNYPVCILKSTGISPQGTKQIELEVQDDGLGLSSIDIVATDKMTVDIDSFTAGTTDSVTVMVTKTNETGSASARLQVEDMAGNVSPCDVADVAIGRGPGTVAFESVLSTQDQVSLINGEPGLKKLEILVNDESFPVKGLRDGVYKEIDISSALAGDDNVVTLSGKGRTGQSCALLIANED